MNQMRQGLCKNSLKHCTNISCYYRKAFPLKNESRNALAIIEYSLWLWEFPTCNNNDIIYLSTIYLSSIYVSIHPRTLLYILSSVIVYVRIKIQTEVDFCGPSLHNPCYTNSLPVHFTLSRTESEMDKLIEIIY